MEEFRWLFFAAPVTAINSAVFQEEQPRPFSADSLEKLIGWAVADKDQRDKQGWSLSEFYCVRELIK